MTIIGLTKFVIRAHGQLYMITKLESIECTWCYEKMQIFMLYK